MEANEIVLVAVAAAASSIIKNGAAIGSGVFLVPVLAMMFPPKIALGLGAPIMLASDIVGLWNYWGEWRNHAKDVLRLIAMGFFGIVLGAYFIHIIPSDIFKKGIGLFAIGFSTYQFLKDSGVIRTRRHNTAAEHQAQSDWRAWLPIGFLGGIATVLAHAGGMVWSTYFVGRQLEKRVLVSSLILLFSMSDFMKVLAYMHLGILSMESNIIVFCMIPIVILSSNFGNMLNKRIHPVHFRRVVLLLIVAVGVNLLVA